MPNIGFLSIIDWNPKDAAMTLEAALASAAGMTPMDAGMLVRKGLPAIALALPLDQANEIGESLRRLGATSFVPTLDQLRAVPEPQLVKRFEHAQGSPFYRATPWVYEPFTLDASNIRVIVRAAPKATRKTAEVESDVHLSHYRRVITTQHVVQRSKIEKMDLLDIETTDGTRVRIDSRKFSFPTARGAGYQSEGVRMDDLAADLAEHAPGAIVDLGFHSFNAGEHLVRRFWNNRPSTKIRQSATSMFDFYSAWASLLYRALAGG